MHRYCLPGVAPACLVSLGLALATPALAQTGGMTPDIDAKIAAIGRVIAPPKSAVIYTPLQEQEPYKGIKVDRDLKYGPADRNRLDVFTAEGASGARPVLIFVHGGGFSRGDKRTDKTPFYDNIPLWAARNGLVGVNMTYRLAPQVQYPSGPEDMAAAVRWVNQNIAKYGGDSKRVYLMGNSAGATHVASYVANPQFYGPDGIGLAGAILLSGIYDLETFGVNPAYQQYFGKDPARYPAQSPLKGLTKAPVPLMVSTAERDPVEFEKQGKQLQEALCKSPKGCQRSVVMSKHNHVSQVHSINSGDTTTTAPVLEFIKTGK